MSITTIYSRMQQKRGALDTFDPSKLLAGEIAVTNDIDTAKQRMYFCISPGTVKRLGTYEDFNQAISDYLATYITQLEGYVSSASTSATNAHTSETNASASATSASNSAASATNSASASSTSATNSQNSAITSQSWAIGNTGTRTEEDTNNSKYYCEQAQQAVSALTNAYVYMGTITFANIPTSAQHQGYTYNISDSFTTDSRFKEGAGNIYTAGTNISYTSDGYWDVLGGKMNDYLRKDGDSATNTTSFTMASTDTDIASGDTHATLFGKILKSISTFRTNIGTLSSLTTTVKTSIVSAINEIVTNIGMLSSLNTLTKDTIVNSINWLHNKLVSAIADEFNVNSTYALGSYCFHMGVLYRNIVAITTSETWNSSHWSQVSITYEISNIFLNFALQYSTSQAYTIGAYSIHSGTLVRCTTAIPSGESWNSLHWTSANSSDFVTWKSLGGASASNPIDISSIQNVREIKIVSYYSSYKLLKSISPADVGTIYDGANTSGWVGCTWNVSSTSVTLGSFWVSETNQISNATTYVYYR